MLTFIKLNNSYRLQKVHWRTSNSKKTLGRIPMANTCSCVLILCENFESEDDKKVFEESLKIACENNEGFSESRIIQINNNNSNFQRINSLTPQSHSLHISNNNNSQSNTYHQR